MWLECCHRSHSGCCSSTKEARGSEGDCLEEVASQPSLERRVGKEQAN